MELIKNTKVKGTLPAFPRKEPFRDRTRSPLPRTSLHTVEQLAGAILRGRQGLCARQCREGHFVFDLEADVTISSEYLLLQRFLERRVSPHLRDRIAFYLRRRQLPQGGWPLFEGGESELSASVKAYFALKLAGDPPEAPHMVRARRLILSLGGASRVNVFTRITLALFGQIPWWTTPAMPVEIVLLPRWFFFHLSKISYWSRTVLVPLLILYARRPICSLGPGEEIGELFTAPPENLRHIDTFRPGALRKNAFILLDRLLKIAGPFIPRRLREQAVRRAEKWMLERMQGEGGIGAIFPAMANAVMALKVLGYPSDHPDMIRGLKALDDLLLDRGDESLCQPCHSPVWDTCLCLSALLEADLSPQNPAIGSAVQWLLDHQVLVRGDWSRRMPTVEPGGWAFQFENALYPDVDDTSMVVMGLLRAGLLYRDGDRERVLGAVNWVMGMQNSDGSWGAFDVNNCHLYLNDIPFADHGALLDPGTSDLTARCIEMLAMLGYRADFPPIARALEFLRREQEECGAWFGRWGVNYLYGTWSVLSALGHLGEDMSQPCLQKAIRWLKSCQNPDHGWGESCLSYSDPALAGKGESTPSQTSWALLGLMAAGEVNSPEVQRGVGYLIHHQNGQGEWAETAYTGTGFPRVFYLRYHGYSRYFPLWALGTYRRLRLGLPTRQREVTPHTAAPLHSRGRC